MDEIKLKISNPEKHFEKTNEVLKNLSPEKKEKLAKASKDFESILTSMMLKSMTKTTSGLFGEEGYGGDIVDTLFETEISKYMTDSKSLGIAETIYKKITGEDLPDYYKTKIKVNSVQLNEVLKNYKIDSEAIAPSQNSIERLKKFEPVIEEASKIYGVHTDIIKSIILAESAGNEKAVSKANAKGLMQLIDSTAAEMGVRNSFDPEQNILGGTKYFSQLLKQYNGNLKLAFAAYNAGPQNVNKYNDVPPFEETKNYVARIFGYLNFFRG